MLTVTAKAKEKLKELLQERFEKSKKTPCQFSHPYWQRDINGKEVKPHIVKITCNGGDI